MKTNLNRRTFMTTLAAAATAAARATPAASSGPSTTLSAPSSPSAATPAVLGGEPVRRTPFPSWPIADAREEQALTAVIRSGKWGRGGGTQVERFEAQYAALTGAKHCLATANGTSALFTALCALDIGPGDEVIVPPYTFVATINAVLLRHALPVFVDSDLETFQIDARKIAAAITPNTRLIVPVHLGGAAADLDTILAAARTRDVPVLEDACQAHLGEWKGRKVGTFGRAGCFSFQASKNLNAGEGGALLTDDANFLETCYTFHNNSRARKNTGSTTFAYRGVGANLRLTEFQAAILLAQMSRLEEQAATRDKNGSYLTSILKEIPGITPAKMYEGCTRNAYHLYMLRYDKIALRGIAEGDVPESAAGRRHSGVRRLHAAEQGAVTERDAGQPRISAHLRCEDARRLERTHRVSGKRAAVRRGGVVHANHAARPARRHGSDRRGDPQDSGERRQARERAVISLMMLESRARDARGTRACHCRGRCRERAGGMTFCTRRCTVSTINGSTSGVNAPGRP